MLIPTLQVYDFSKDTLSNHIQYGHDIPAVTYIFKHHHLCLVFFSCPHHFPMILNGDSYDYFGSYILYACLERSNNHRFVPLPWCCYDYPIELCIFDHFFPVPLISQESLRHRFAFFCYQFIG